MKKIKLSFKERIAAVIAYFSILFSTLWFLAGDLSSLIAEGSPYNYVLVSGGLLLIFGAYIAEPYFTKPTDVLVNATGVILFLLALDQNTEYVGKEAILVVAIVSLALSIVILFANERNKGNKLLDFGSDLLVKIGQSRIAFSVIYLATVFTFFVDDKVGTALLVTFWAVFVSGFLVENLIAFLFRRAAHLTDDTEYVGRVVGLENKRILKVEKDLRVNVAGTKSGDILAIKIGTDEIHGVVVKESRLVDKELLTIFTLQDETQEEVLPYSESVVTKVNEATQEDSLGEKMNSSLIKQHRQVIGYVHPDSDVQKIKFRVFETDRSKQVSEGSIVAVEIRGKKVLYQVLNASTKEEELDRNDGDTYFLATARKLGSFKTDKREIENVKWLPDMYSPVFALDNFTDPKTDTDIGELPETDYPIRIDNYNHLVTHNTAILGILGVGKSCLTFELIQKVIKHTSSKVLCFDITGEYNDKDQGLSRYVSDEFISSVSTKEINDTLESEDIEVKDSQEDGGNTKALRELLEKIIGEFMKDETKERVLIINPEEIVSIQQTDNAKQRNRGGNWETYAPFATLTVAEITRIISEVSLDLCKIGGMHKEAKMLLVYEEAHSLIPEWNSAANEGDKTAANGTARVILQGRKYGLGSFVVTQRTANISKTILNQCNTVFALKVFDDTGKQFLENYVGSDYASILPSLDDRHAVVTGKAFKLKQPVIVVLNHMDDVMLPIETDE